MKMSALAAALSALAISSPALAVQDTGGKTTDVTASDVLQQVAVEQYAIDSATAPIRSRAALQHYLRVTPNSPLFKMSDAARSRFISKLVFTPRGLGSYSYLELENLSITDAYRILSLFGEQRSLRVIPGLTPTNSVEQSMLLVSPSPQTLGVVYNYICQVPIQTPHAPPSFCEYDYGSACNDRCGH